MISSAEIFGNGAFFEFELLVGELLEEVGDWTADIPELLLLIRFFLYWLDDEDGWDDDIIFLIYF